VVNKAWLSSGSVSEGVASDHAVRMGHHAYETDPASRGGGRERNCTGPVPGGEAAYHEAVDINSNSIDAGQGLTGLCRAASCR
jgi:hypothetical protein